MQNKLRILITLVPVFVIHHQLISAMSVNIQRIQQPLLQRALSMHALPATSAMSLVAEQQIFPRISTSLMRRCSLSPIVAHYNLRTLAQRMQQAGANDGDQGDKEHAHNNSGWQRWRTLLSRLGSYGAGAALVTGMSAQALREVRADEQEQDIAPDFMSAYIGSLYSDEVDPTRFEAFVQAVRNDEHVYKQCMHLLPAHLGRLLQTGAGYLFLSQMFKTKTGFKDLSSVAIEFLTHELAMHRAGEPFNANIQTVLQKLIAIDWEYFSTYCPQAYACLMQGLCADVTQFASVDITNIKYMLLNCPRAYHLPFINALLQYYDVARYAQLPPKEATYLTEFIADLIILFELDIDVPHIAQSKAFADNILQKMADLRESYGYHLKHPIGDIQSALRSWVEAELNDERKRMAHIVEQDLGICINIDQIKVQALRQNMQMRGASIIKNLGRSESHEQEDGAQAYIRRKLEFLGFSFDRPIEINQDGATAINTHAGLNSDNKVLWVKYKLEINDDLMIRESPLSFNFTLAHEMIHYYDYHNDLQITILAAIDNTLPDTKIAPYIERVAANNLLDEKIADTLACLRVGPTACHEAALVFMQSYMHGLDKACHAPWPVRTAALATCAVAMREEDAGQQFDPQQETAFTLWMRTKNRHPDQDVFLKRFYR